MTSPKHYLQFKDFSADEYAYLFERIAWIKARFKAYEPYHPMFDRTLVMIFEKASTRTRLSFEAGMAQLGGSAIYLNTRDSQLGRGEPVEDAAHAVPDRRSGARPLAGAHESGDGGSRDSGGRAGVSGSVFRTGR